MKKQKLVFNLKTVSKIIIIILCIISLIPSAPMLIYGYVNFLSVTFMMGKLLFLILIIFASNKMDVR